MMMGSSGSESEKPPPGYSEGVAQPGYTQSANVYYQSSAGYYTQPLPTLGGTWHQPAGYNGFNACCCCTIPGGARAVAITDIVLSSILLIIICTFVAIFVGIFGDGSSTMWIGIAPSIVVSALHVICIAASITVLFTLHRDRIWAPIFWIVATVLRFVLQIISVFIFYFVGISGGMGPSHIASVALEVLLYSWFITVIVTLIQFKKYNRKSGTNAIGFSQET